MAFKGTLPTVMTSRWTDAAAHHWMVKLNLKPAFYYFQTPFKTASLSY